MFICNIRHSVWLWYWTTILWIWNCHLGFCQVLSLWQLKFVYRNFSQPASPCHQYSFNKNLHIVLYSLCIAGLEDTRLRVNLWMLQTEEKNHQLIELDAGWIFTFLFSWENPFSLITVDWLASITSTFDVRFYHLIHLGSCSNTTSESLHSDVLSFLTCT